MREKKKLTSLQSLRALAFLGIFLLHAGCVYDWAVLGVSVFFVMSGFLMVYSYYDKALSISIKDAFLFSIKKIKALYPLHIITMLLAVIRPAAYIVQNKAYFAIGELVKNIIYNIFLIQTWVPNVGVNVSLNGVAWYLSVCLFLYFIFPYLLWMIKKIDNQVLLIVIALLYWVIMYFIGYITIDRYGLDGRLFTWATYCFPIYRLGDFFAGCVAGYCFLRDETSDVSVISATVAEVATVMLCGIFIVFSAQPQQLKAIRVLTENWTLCLIPLAVLLVLMFARCEGLLTKVLNNKCLVWLGDLSAYLFLIHYFVTQNIKTEIANRFIQLNTFTAWLLILFELVATIVLSVCYRKIEVFINNIKKSKE